MGDGRTFHGFGDRAGSGGSLCSESVRAAACGNGGDNADGIGYWLERFQQPWICWKLHPQVRWRKPEFAEVNKSVRSLHTLVRIHAGVGEDDGLHRVFSVGPSHAHAQHGAVAARVQKMGEGAGRVRLADSGYDQLDLRGCRSKGPRTWDRGAAQGAERGPGLRVGGDGQEQGPPIEELAERVEH